jgi:membrane protein DedA with SNARE-associated domain
MRRVEGEPAGTPGLIGRKVPLKLLLVPFAIAATGATIADWIWPQLVTSHPAVLITMSPKNRFLLLTAPQLGLIAFFVIGFLRLILTDPITYVLGRQYGDAALSWIESKTSSAEQGKSFIRKAERLFGRAAPVFILVAPSALWCVLAGSARMKVWLFVTCNVVGTVARLALFWYAADALEEPLKDLLAGIERLQIPLLALTIGFGVLQTVRHRRRGGLETPAEMEAEIRDGA